MLKVGDILWEFYEDTYFIEEISKLLVMNIGETQYYRVDTNGIIGPNKIIFLPVKKIIIL